MLILIKEVPSDKIVLTDKFIVNDNFEDKNYKLRIPHQQKKEIQARQKSRIKDRAMFERKYIIESKIMQILKTEKTMQYNELLF